MLEVVREWLIRKLGGCIETEKFRDPGPLHVELEFAALQLRREKEKNEVLEKLLFEARQTQTELKAPVPSTQSELTPIKTAKIPWSQLRFELERADAQNLQQTQKEKKDGIPT